jgi:hypothetical protein
MPNDDSLLTYSIGRERLSGNIGPHAISVRAVAGGGRGSTVHPAGQPGQLGPASWDTQRQAVGTRRGGPLPPGTYIVHKPKYKEHLGRAAYLEQTLTSSLYKNPNSPLGLSATVRGGQEGKGAFYIHGRGEDGSDGCIVPMESRDWFMGFMDLLGAYAPVVLVVGQ